MVKRMEPWTPEIGATGRRHVAGIKFRDELARIRSMGRHERDGSLVASKKDLETALEFAADALEHEVRRASD